MTFRIHAMDYAWFAPLFELSDAALLAQRALRRVADAKPGYPCRVSLQDAEVGERLLLLNYRHLDGNTPYAATHAIFVREGAEQAHPAPGEVPPVMRHRLLSLRGFDAGRMMLRAEVTEGAGLANALEAMFDDRAVEVVHIHYAGPGCFAGRATRG
ncbi:DUF1203 domain-containing protein [Marinovum sp.]|uniref:DUF1203 domain-containing protein n=1 Tax=Marinovum sp. TaxID=2024839 RepID=UPI002B2735ED|nr:DUF1203 domain-containing protein [Marinovum sp.]